MEEGSGLQASLLNDSRYFIRMIDLLPTHCYFDTEMKKLIDKNMEKADKYQGTRHRKPLSQKSKLKRARYDPTQAVTVTQMKNLVDKDQEEIGSKRQKIDSKEELREKLKKKIEAMKGKRKITNGESTHLDGKKSGKKGNKKQNKNKPKHSASSASMFQSSKGSSDSGITGDPSPKPVFNKEGKLVFSRFDFSESDGKEKKQDASMVSKGKDYKKILQKVERQKEKVQKLKETDKQAAKLLQDKIGWKKALLKAEGTKLKDNPELLKKSLKKKEKIKQQSEQKWAQRDTKVKEMMKKKQDERKKNIRTKKQNIVDKKIKKAKKKGRIIPGF